MILSSWTTPGPHTGPVTTTHHAETSWENTTGTRSSDQSLPCNPRHARILVLAWADTSGRRPSIFSQPWSYLLRCASVFGWTWGQCFFSSPCTLVFSAVLASLSARLHLLSCGLRSLLAAAVIITRPLQYAQAHIRGWGWAGPGEKFVPVRARRPSAATAERCQLQTYTQSAKSVRDPMLRWEEKSPVLTDHSEE